MQQSRRTFLKYGAAALGTCLLGSYPVIIERTTVVVNRYQIPVPRLPGAFSGFTLVHLTDLHYGFLMPRSFFSGVVERANTLSADLIVCTGDYVHERNAHLQIDEVWPLLGQLKAPKGVLSVLGNHDHWADGARSMYWMEKTGQSLRHQAKRIEKNGESLWFIGAGDLWEDHVDIEHLTKVVPENDCRIILAHNPDSADTSFRARSDLFICGHTHGGQVRIPLVGAPILPVRNKEYTSGLRQSRQGDPVFISRGIGCAIYPVRFNCFPEIAVLTLVAASSG